MWSKKHKKDEVIEGSDVRNASVRWEQAWTAGQYKISLASKAAAGTILDAIFELVFSSTDDPPFREAS